MVGRAYNLSESVCVKVKGRFVVKRSWLPIALVAFTGSFLGCGGSGSGTAAVPKTPNLNGIWNIQLSENQAQLIINTLNYPSPAPVSTGVTQIDIDLVQSGGVLSAQTSIPAMNVGCRSGNSGQAWWQSGAWITTLTVFTFETGTLVDQTLNISLTETGQATQSGGTLVFTGAVQPDGSLAGSVTDSCTGTSATWTATRISALP